MNTITLKDSELYDLLHEVCEELEYTEFMPAPCCMLTEEKTGKERAVVAMCCKSENPFDEGGDIKAYINEFVTSAVKKYGNKGILYPFKIQKSDQCTKLILRGAFQPEGYKTNFRGEEDVKLIKANLDEVESLA